MKKLLLITSCLLLVSCATKETKPAFGPHGGILHPVACVEPVDNCYLEAIKICPSGFNVVEAMESPTISLASGIPLLAKGYTLQVECK